MDVLMQLVIFFHLLLICHGAENKSKTENEKTHKKVRAIPDSVYDRFMDIIEGKGSHNTKHAMNGDEYKLYTLKKSIPEKQFACENIFDPISGNISRRITIPSLFNSNTFVPRESEREKIVSHFYKKYKGEGARKLADRIRNTYAGISREYIQTWINNNEDSRFKIQDFFPN